MLQPVPSFHIDLTQLACQQRRERWQDLMPTHRLDIRDERVATGPAAITSWFLGQIALGRSSTHLMRLQRTHAEIRRDQIDHYAFGVTLGGSWSGDAGGRDFGVVGDGVFVMDMARPMSAEMRDMDTVQVVIPRDLLDAVAAPRDVHGIALHGGTAGLLHDHILSLARRLPELTLADAPGVAQATLAILAAALRPSADTLAMAAPALDGLRLARVRHYIQSRLRDPALSPETICSAMRLSRSSLYQLFEEFGGVSAYIQQRRLAKIRAVLAQGSDPRRLFEIATEYGFNHPAHFSRSFRATYGVSPREVRRRGHQAMVTGNSVAPRDDTMMTWLRSLSGAV